MYFSVKLDTWIYGVIVGRNGGQFVHFQFSCVFICLFMWCIVDSITTEDDHSGVVETFGEKNTKILIEPSASKCTLPHRPLQYSENEHYGAIWEAGGTLFRGKQVLKTCNDHHLIA